MWLEKLVKVYSVGVVCDENVLNFILTPYDNSGGAFWLIVVTRVKSSQRLKPLSECAILVEILQIQKNNADIVIRACMCIRAIGDPAHVVKFGLVGGCEMLIEILRMHIDNKVIL